MLLVSLRVCLACLLVKKKVPQDEMLLQHYDIRQPPKNDVEDVRLWLPDNREEIPSREECLVAPFDGNDFKQLVQANE